MKKMEYTFMQGADDRLHTLEAGKHDEYSLPEFSKEVPTSSKKKTGAETTTIEYEWKNSKSDIIRIKRVDFRKNEDLSDLYRVPVREGVDSAAFKHNNSIYMIRKSVKEVAEALYNAYGSIRGAIEPIVGYLRTVLGAYYVIARIERDSWVFDRRIAKHGINYVDVDSIDRKGKDKLCEMITERIAQLHSNNLIMGRFTLNNILLNGNDLKFTDLRRMRISRRRSLVIEEFKGVLQYLFGLGVANREDIYASIAYYATQNENGCGEWYYEKTGKKASDPLDIIGRIEEEIYS